MGETGIQWTGMTWNPVTGCTKVSAGCRNCYAEAMAGRFPALYPEGFGKVACHEDRLEPMLRRRKVPGGMVFVNSMSDLFHEAVPFAFIDKVFAVMALKPGIVFQVLTKRPERMREHVGRWGAMFRDRVAWHMSAMSGGEEMTRWPSEWQWPLPNVWLGVSVEDQESADRRIPVLLETPAAVRFVSYEPALGPVDLKPWLGFVHEDEFSGDGTHGTDGTHGEDCGISVGPCRLHDPWRRGLDWVIVGGESGGGARPFDVAWARKTVADCREAGVACFVKQLGANPYDSAKWVECDVADGRYRARGTNRLKLKDRKGGDMGEWPEDLRVREFPGHKGRKGRKGPAFAGRYGAASRMDPPSRSATARQASRI